MYSEIFEELEKNSMTMSSLISFLLSADLPCDKAQVLKLQKEILSELHLEASRIQHEAEDTAALHPNRYIGSDIISDARADMEKASSIAFGLEELMDDLDEAIDGLEHDRIRYA